jgi:hypothetical protein
VRQVLKSNGRRVEAYIETVHYDGGLRGSHFYHLELRDPDQPDVVFISDPIVGKGGSIKTLLNENMQRGLERTLTLPVYIDNRDKALYFVDIPADIEKYLGSKTMVS